MAITPKIIHYKHKTYSDGTNPIIIQSVINGKITRKVLGRCTRTEWLPSKNRVGAKNIRYCQINDDIEKALVNFGNAPKVTFVEFFQQQIDVAFDNQQVSKFELLQLVFCQIQSFKKGIDFNDIDADFIVRFSVFLRVSLGNSVNTIRTKMQTLGKVIKAAIKAQIVNENPMLNLSFPKQKIIKNKLTVEEIKILLNAHLNGIDEMVRDVFVSSIFLRGIRIGDLLCLTPNDITDNRITYKERKTGKIHNVAIAPQLTEILNKWQGKSKHGFLFDLLDVPAKLMKDNFIVKRAITNANSKINTSLKKIGKSLGIDKNLSMHIARHSFARLANNTIKDTTVTKDLLGHSSLTVHEGYISEISDNLELDKYAMQIFDVLRS